MHESVLLILKTEPTAETIEVAIAPWSDEAASENGNQARWDYWRVGGRWPRKLLVKPGRHSMSGPEAWEFEFERKNNNKDYIAEMWPDGVDAARFCDIDWHEMARRSDPKPPLTCYSICDGRVWESQLYRVATGEFYEEGDPKYDYHEHPEAEWQAIMQGIINRAEPTDWVVMLDVHD